LGILNLRFKGSSMVCVFNVSLRVVVKNKLSVLLLYISAFCFYCWAFLVECGRYISVGVFFTLLWQNCSGNQFVWQNLKRSS
jgi:hypothetical protein